MTGTATTVSLVQKTDKTDTKNTGQQKQHTVQGEHSLQEQQVNMDAERQALFDSYIEHQADLLRFLTARTKDEMTAQDLLQDLYIRLTKAQFSGAILQPKSYLFRMANNLMLDQKKQAMRRQLRHENWSDNNLTISPIGEAIDETPQQDRALNAKQHLQSIAKKIEKLPPKARAVFIDCKVNGLSYKEAAEKHEISVKTVEKHMSKAIASLASLKDRINFSL